MDLDAYAVAINGLTEASFDNFHAAERWAFRASNPSDEVLVYRHFEDRGRKPECMGDYSNAWRKVS